jgi:hypothetical protein
MDQLSGTERSQLAMCEQVIERGKRSWIDMGRALREIRDARLYRATHGTFEDYCEQRWEIARRHAYRLMDGAAAVVNVSDRTQGITLEAMRPLAGLPPEQQREVWAAAEAAAPRDAQGQPKITGRIVAEAAGKVVPLRRSASVTLRPGVPEESAHALLQAWEPRDLVKFYSELGYAMQQRGMLSNWTDVIQDVLNAKAAG